MSNVIGVSTLLSIELGWLDNHSENNENRVDLPFIEDIYDIVVDYYCDVIEVVHMREEISRIMSMRWHDYNHKDIDNTLFNVIFKRFTNGG
jgi:hypothetical protein